MVKFVAYQSVDTRDLSEIGLLQNMKKNVTRKHEGKTFDAKSGDIKMHADGNGMFFVLKKPVSGTMKKIAVEVAGADDYTIGGLSIKLKTFKKFFKGDYESKIFKGNDKMTGSSQSDKLAGFNGADTIKGGNGGDSIGGANGSDKLYGENGADLMTGGKGSDLLDGGLGTNTLTGNSGNDSFRFSSQLGASYSSITDFAAGRDSIELDNTAFAGIGGKGKLAASQFFLATDYAGEAGAVIYDKATGVMSYSATGGPRCHPVRRRRHQPGPFQRKLLRRLGLRACRGAVDLHGVAEIRTASGSGSPRRAFPRRDSRARRRPARRGRAATPSAPRPWRRSVM